MPKVGFQKEKENNKIRRPYFLLALAAAALVLVAVSSFVDAGTSRPFRYYTDSGSTAFTYYTNGSGENISYWGINTDDPRCELDINGTVCINRSGFYYAGVNVSSGGADGNNYPTAMTVNSSGSNYQINLNRSGLSTLTAPFTISAGGGNVSASGGLAGWPSKFSTATDLTILNLSCGPNGALQTLSNDSICINPVLVEVDPVYSAAASSIAGIGNCAGENSTHVNVTRNTTTSGVQCYPVAKNPGSSSTTTESGNITGSGITNYVGRWTNGTNIGTGSITDSGSLITVNTTINLITPTNSNYRSLVIFSNETIGGSNNGKLRFEGYGVNGYNKIEFNPEEATSPSSTKVLFNVHNRNWVDNATHQHFSIYTTNTTDSLIKRFDLEYNKTTSDADFSNSNLNLYDGNFAVVEGNASIGAINPISRQRLYIYEPSVGAVAMRIDRGSPNYVSFVTPTGSPSVMEVRVSSTDTPSSFTYVSAGGIYQKGDVRFAQNIYTDKNASINGSANISSILYTPELCLAGDCRVAWPVEVDPVFSALWPFIYTNITTSQNDIDTLESTVAGIGNWTGNISSYTTTTLGDSRWGNQSFNSTCAAGTYPISFGFNKDGTQNSTTCATDNAGLGGNITGSGVTNYFGYYTNGTNIAATQMLRLQNTTVITLNATLNTTVTGVTRNFANGCTETSNSTGLYWTC